MTVQYYHYVYKTTNLMNSKIYVGKHSSKIHPDKDRYMGSSIQLKRDIAEFGRQHFKREIIHVADSDEEAYEIERLLVDATFCSRIDVYNRMIGGMGFREYNKTKVKETCLAVYGTDNPSKSEIVKDRIKKVNLERYGVEYAFQNEEVKSRHRNTINHLYGVENVSQIEEVKAKKKETCLSNYGVENPLKSSVIMDKVMSTNLERYGCENPQQNSDVRLKTQTTNMEKYGSVYAFCNPEIRDKMYETNLEKYGHKHYSETVEHKAKMSKRNSGAKMLYNPETKLTTQVIKDKVQEYIDSGWEFWSKAKSNAGYYSK